MNSGNVFNECWRNSEEKKFGGTFGKMLRKFWTNLKRKLPNHLIVFQTKFREIFEIYGFMKAVKQTATFEKNFCLKLFYVWSYEKWEKRTYFWQLWTPSTKEMFPRQIGEDFVLWGPEDDPNRKSKNIFFLFKS